MARVALLLPGITPELTRIEPEPPSVLASTIDVPWLASSSKSSSGARHPDVPAA